jgi:S-layer protein (TIGR01567 family)
MKDATLTAIVAMIILLSISMAPEAADNVWVRGQAATGNFEWNAQNFAGFYYDIKDDIGTETLSTTLTDKKLSGDSPYGVKYVTTAQAKEFKYEDWGAFKVMGFLTDRYFAGYVESVDNADKNLLFKESTDENSLSRGQLQKILIDDDTEKTVTSGTSIKLEEGYELAIKSIDIDGNKIYLELSKDGSVVDSKVISLSKTDATMADKTYYYKNPAVGDQKKLVTIAVHFKNAFRGADQYLAIVDGLWQISGEATEVNVDTQYDKMTITSVDTISGTITMENKDNAITLSKNKDTALMSGISIKTVDNNTLRYYLYKPEEPIKGAAELVAVAEAAPAVEKKTEASAAEPAAVPGGKTAEPSSQNIDGAEVRQTILPNGTIIEIIPLQMKVGVQRQIVAAISQTPELNMTTTVKTAIVDIEKIKPEETHQSALPVFDEMKIDLVVTPDDFKIAKQHLSDKQHVPFGDFVVWRWLVTPTDDGLHRVDFVVSVPGPSEKVVLVKTYDIEVNYQFTLTEWLRKNYQWLFGSIFGSGVILWFFKRREGGK